MQSENLTSSYLTIFRRVKSVSTLVVISGSTEVVISLWRLPKRKKKMATTDSVREKALADYRKKLLEHKELEARLKESKYHSIW